MTEAAALLSLLAWLSPAFPTGGYAYSHGLEWAVESGNVRDAEELRDWLETTLVHGAGRSDAILLRHAHRASDDADALVGIAELARSAVPGRERQVETIAQGSAFIAAAAAWGSLPPFSGNDMYPLPYPVAVGLVAGLHAVPEDDTALAYLHAVTSNLISAAVRLVPLGQSLGLAVLAGLHPVILRVGQATRDCALDDIGGCLFRADLASLCHETQYTRLFRS